MAVDLLMTPDGDLVVAANGDLAIAYGDHQVALEALFRLKTQPGDWTLSPDVGAGLERFVGQPNEAYVHAAIEAAVEAAFQRGETLPASRISCIPTGDHEVLVVAEFESLEQKDRQVVVMAGLDMRQGLVFARHLFR